MEDFIQDDILNEDDDVMGADTDTDDDASVDQTDDSETDDTDDDE